LAKKWVHFIGIAGITTAPLATVFKQQGWLVTGSDENIYSPAKDWLENASITCQIGYSYEHLVNQDGKYPDLVIMGSSKHPKNKEFLFAQKHNLVIKSYPEILEEYVVKPGKSIVVVGSFGKTTITALLTYIFEQAGLHPSYMFGGLTASIAESLKFKTPETQYSIIEGDEYVASKVDLQSKFFYYHPDILVLNGLEWDHTDVFTTPEEYFNNFRKLIDQMPAEGIIFANHSENIDQVLSGVKQKVVYLNNDRFQTPTMMLGKFNKANVAVAHEVSVFLGLNPEIVRKSLAEFKGIKRRLEIKYQTTKLTIIDDFGSTPAKAAGSLAAIKEEYPDSFVVCVFEPSEGGRTEKAANLFKGVFKYADRVLFPEFKKMKNRVSAADFDLEVKNHHTGAQYFADNNKLVAELENIVKSSSKPVVVAFLGSHDFEAKIAQLMEHAKKI
jgi:UDP-N-acetylmuramate: L-alanyl-gamma-D-glutamyl-meso-diaminopimelate ligase